MLIRFDPESPVGLSDQIAAQVRGALIGGSVRPGDRLPPARELANSLDVNMHTVLRAYAMLRDEGLIELRRGRGAHIRSDADASGAALDDKIRALLDEAQRLGVSRAQLVRRVQEAPS
jgi:DNA-binding transcriptional regulator YhcF (GntR family)